MNRRDFFIRVGGVCVAVPAVLHLVACGDGGGGDAAGGAGGEAAGDDVVGETTASAGHKHTVTVHCADVRGDEAVTYTSSKTNGHTHAVALSVAQLAQLARGETVTLETTSLHLHTWNITAGDACA